MIETSKLLGVLHRHHVLNILDHTDRRSIAVRVAADGTRLAVADIVAHATTLHLMLHLLNGLRQLLDVLRVLTQQVQHQSQGRLASHTRQLGKLLYRPFQQL